MRMFDANPPVLRDLKDESEVLAEKDAGDFTVITARHPTLGKLVLIRGRTGAGVVVETEE
ncbi:hypothetical protein [Candidatus Thiodictyon syntrophicum]|jgi:hypothetical protein|uniref:Uncharacterized protein n=1 Tax=Candidatus Thiodictyon syntrophicum TaxID=1166950 RepID=A0A2K8UG44_9GAMM|nr:hypothetical protein [Candidatus Thiodictyon syntrophicum]AUB84492.1 hypothetical protein THSYN_28540 [Candidatus Thiodictyon syntrophicum]